MVNHEIKYADQLQCPGPPEMAAIVRETPFCVSGPYVPSDSTDSQVRGLGAMVAFWERMRSICSKTNIYNGPILQSDGSQCLTSSDLDRAHAVYT